MQKYNFHNMKFDDENLQIKKIRHVENLNLNVGVDINRLLNRVKIEKQNENKQKAIFVSFGILLISLMGIFVTIIK
jgi:hypothetical protein